MNTNELLENLYSKADNLNDKDIEELFIRKDIRDAINIIVSNEETMKGIFTCIISSLTYKIIHPQQDIRFHKIDLPNGYSGRSFDTKYVTPFLKRHAFAGAMKESGWLTRSIEQDAPFDDKFPGKIQKKEVKESFLKIFKYIECENGSAENCLLFLLSLSIKENLKRKIILINPVESETKFTINEIIDMLNKHFYYSYKSRGASILPVIALYSIYECIITELKRFNNKILDLLNSHNSCDKSSGATGDIVIRNNDLSIYEVVEVKFDIPINSTMVEDAYKKFSNLDSIQRYYILSTKQATDDESVKISEEVCKIREEHGCQVIVNGIFPTIKYYLRLVENTDLFLQKYILNVQNNTELDSEHKKAWNELFKGI